MNKKKIALIHTDFRIYWPARINHFYNSLDKTIYDFNVIELSGHGGNYNFDNRGNLPRYWDCLFENIPIFELSSSIIKQMLFARLKELRPDILIAGAIPFPSGASALSYSVEHKIPLIVFDDARIDDVPRNWLVNCVKRQLYSCVDAVFCPAPAWNATYNFFGLKEQQIFYGVDVIDNTFFQKVITDSSILDKVGQGYILNVGRQIKKKNLLNLLKAYNYVCQKISSIPKLLLVGDGDCHQELLAFVENNKLNERVIFLPFLSQENLVSIYRSASLFILPSSFGETWGLVINEAMASGLPVIVSNKVGCASTLVKDGENGYIFEIDDIFGLEKCLLKFFELSESEKKNMSESSNRKIGDWDLKQFTIGLSSAIRYVESNKKRNGSFLGKRISKIWKGTYNSI